MCSIMLVSGVLQIDSVIHTHTHTFFKFFSIIGYYKTARYWIVCSTVDPCCWSIACIVVCIYYYHSPNLSLPPFPCGFFLSFVFMFMSLLLFCKQVHLYFFKLLREHFFYFTLIWGRGEWNPLMFQLVGEEFFFRTRNWIRQNWYLEQRLEGLSFTIRAVQGPPSILWPGCLVFP